MRRFTDRVSKNSGGSGRLDLGLGPLEARIMDVLWDEPRWRTVQEVCDTLNASATRPLSYSTIKTVLCNLTGKRYLKKRVVGRAYEYVARFTRAEAERAVVAEFVRPMVSGRSPSLIANLVDEIAVSEDALVELERLIDERRKQ